MKKKISLVLGSGGARGLTQIGVINWLVEQGYEIDEVVGCSIGSLVGAAFAEGKLGELGEWMSKLTKRDVFRLMDFGNPIYGILKGERIMHTLQSVFEDVHIEDMKVKYTAVATDLVHEKEVLFRTGNVYRAIRASIAIPGVFKAVQAEDKFLVDGGILNPLPINHVQHKDNMVIAVNLDGMPVFKHQIEYAKLSSLGLLQESYLAMRRRLSLLSVELYQPDFVVNIPHNSAGIWDFDKSSSLIEKGYEIAEATLSRYLK